MQGQVRVRIEQDITTQTGLHEMRNDASSGMILGETNNAMSGGQLATKMKLDTMSHELMSCERLLGIKGTTTLIAMPVMKIGCLRLRLDPESFTIN